MTPCPPSGRPKGPVGSSHYTHPQLPRGEPETGGWLEVTSSQEVAGCVPASLPLRAALGPHKGSSLSWLAAWVPPKLITEPHARVVPGTATWNHGP